MPLRLSLTLLLLTACSTATPSPSDPDAGATDAAAPDGAGDPDGGGDPQFCARQTAETLGGGERVVVCEEGFAAAPFIHLPPDRVEADGSTTVYVAFRSFSELGGATHDYAVPEGAPWAETEAGFGNARYAYFVYRAGVRGTTVEEIVPAVRIDDRVFHRLLAGKVFEGLISPRSVDATTGEVRWAFDMHTLPIRIRLDDAPGEKLIDASAGYPRFALMGRIENANAAVTAADGSCLAPLDDAGDADPFFSATGDGDRVTILRHPAMHGPFDDEFTLDWPAGTMTGDGGNMGRGLFVAIPDLIRSPPPAWNDGTSSPHGTPWGGPSADLNEVTSGGEPCTR